MQLRTEGMVSACDLLGVLNVAIVVPTFNRRDITVKFVRRLNSQRVPITIFISDSGSSDGTIDALAKEPNVRIIHASHRAWWSAAVNRGVERALEADAGILIVMNDDIEFDEDLISALIAAHGSHPVSIVSPIQWKDSETFVGTLYEGRLRHIRHLTLSPKDEVVETSNGCFLLIPREVFSTVGLFDEDNCPHLYGDTEFQLRARRAGFPTRVCSTASIRQSSQTDYLARLAFRGLFTFEASPLHWRAYKTFGKALFGGIWGFAIFGLRFHLDFLKTVVKVMRVLAQRKLNALKDRYALYKKVR